MTVSWPFPQADIDEWFVMTIRGVDPAHDADVHVVAINDAGVFSEPSNVIHIAAEEFCGSVNCNDTLTCTRDICGTDFCANSPDSTRCEDLNECTQDFCDLAQGCVHLITTGACNDGLACTVLDSRTDGVCAGIVNCPEGRFCSAITGDCELENSTTTLPSTPTTTTTTLAGPFCGDTVVDPAEQCDDGDTIWKAGDGCREDCRLIICGDADGSGGLSVADVLYILYAALGRSDCDPAVCNVDNNIDSITASDALRLLRVAVGVPLELNCPPL